MRHALEPKPPTAEQIELIRKFRIDIVNGTVHKPGSTSSKGYGSETSDGYVRVAIIDYKRPHLSRFYNRSHLIWWAATGCWPTLTIDHINRIRSDDRIGNLREATMTQQRANRSNQKMDS